MVTDTSNSPNKRRKVDIAEAVHPISASVVSEQNKSFLIENYKTGLPYPHCVLTPLCDHEFMLSVRNELVQLPATYKETDLFKVYQTPDLANLDPKTQPELATALPNLLKLRDALYSEEFRGFLSDVTGCGPLTAKTDMAANVYSQNGHLLVHDDVIGTRKISYIIYLTDPDEGWTREDGGALELYPRIEGTDLPAANPTKTVLPLFNTMGMFTVVPGESFHAVQEVYASDKPRVSIQGWFHAAEAPVGSEKASLQQVKRLAEEVRGAWESEEKFAAPDGATVAPADLEYLAQAGVNPIYLKPESMQSIRKKMCEESMISLRDFLLPEKGQQIRSAVSAADSHDNIGRGKCPDYKAGTGGPWTLTGPPHMQRFVTVDKLDSEENGAAFCVEHYNLAKPLAEIRDHLFRSREFSNYLAAISACDLIARRSGARRFRPGLDYSVAVHPDDDTILDASLTFCNDESEADQESWASGEVGGFECYIDAEDEENPEVVAVYDADNDDGDNVVNVDLANNTLNLGVRTSATMRFVKYVSASAPGSRCDVFAEFKLDLGDDEEGEDIDDDESDVQ